MQIQVIQEDLFNGKRMSCRECPISLATNRLLLPGLFVNSSPYSITFYKDSKSRSKIPIWEVKTPLEARDFMHLFDTNRDVVPWEFELEIPKEFLK